MSQELYYHLLQGLRSKLTGYVCTAAAIGLVATVPTQKTEATKTLSLTAALALSVAGTINFRTQTEADAALNDFRINTGLQRQRNLFTTATIQTQPTEPVSYDWFDFSEIGNNRDKFPNVIICGEPGQGKTSLAEYLGVILKADKRYAVHPHAKPGDFAGFNAILGGARNYGSPDDECVNWSDIESGKVQPTIAQVLQSLLLLMNERYQEYYVGKTSFAEVDVYIDELPSIVSNLGKKFIAGILPQLLMECRKVGIRIWLLTQGSQVRMLGLEGMSDLREGITFIRLGRLAVRHTKNKQLQAILQNTSRPCLVDDRPAKLPGWSEITGAIKAFVSQQEPAQIQEQPTEVKVTDYQLDSLRKQLDQMTEVELEPELAELIEMNTPEKGKQWVSRDSVIRLADDCIDSGNFAKLPAIVKRCNDDRKLMYWIGMRLITEHAKSITNVIEQGWGMRGRRFDEARAVYYELGLDKLQKQMR